MKLNELRDNPGASRPRKRLGRGIGSGTGKTAGKGHKGQLARSGGTSDVGFEGGQMPLYRRLPKRGFKNPFRRDYVELNVGRLQQAIDAGKLTAGQAIDAATLVESGVLRRAREGVRLLAKGTLSVPLNLVVAGASRAAVAAVEQAGGTVTIQAPKGANAAAATTEAG